jgi:hypothetical protein
MSWGKLLGGAAILIGSAIAQSIARNAASAQDGSPKGAQPAAAADGAATDDDDLEATAGMLDEWFKVKDESRRFDLLIDHLMTLDQQKYSDFAANLQTFRTRTLQVIKNHEAEEINAWGSYMEDRMAYIAARERHGAKDPKWQRAHNELVAQLEYLDWTITASEGAWSEISKRRKK